MCSSDLFQEQQPGRLFGVVELAGASGVFPEDVVDVLEGLFKHGAGWPFVGVCRGLVLCDSSSGRRLAGHDTARRGAEATRTRLKRGVMWTGQRINGMLPIENRKTGSATPVPATKTMSPCFFFNTDETESEGKGAHQRMIDESCIAAWGD